MSCWIFLTDFSDFEQSSAAQINSSAQRGEASFQESPSSWVRSTSTSSKSSQNPHKKSRFEKISQFCFTYLRLRKWWAPKGTNTSFSFRSWSLQVCPGGGASKVFSNHLSQLSSLSQTSCCFQAPLKPLSAFPNLRLSLLGLDCHKFCKCRLLLRTQFGSLHFCKPETAQWRIFRQFVVSQIFSARKCGCY